jgi:hypothetical protein
MHHESDSTVYNEYIQKPNTTQKNLFGTTVAQCDILVDDLGNEGYFFVFNDIAVRWSGTYRLRFVIHEIVIP